MSVRDLLQRRAGIIERAGALTRKPKMTAEDLAEAEILMRQGNDLLAEVRAAEEGLSQPYQPATRPDPQAYRNSSLYAQPTAGGPSNSRDALISETYVRSLFDLPMTSEHRALQSTLDVSGGYLQPPMQFVNELIKGIDEVVPFMASARVIDIQGTDTLGAPTLESDPSDPTWTHELSIGSEDSDMDFGRRELHVHPLAKYVKISKTLLRRVPSATSIVRDALSRKVGSAMEASFMTGNGSGQPLGIFTASPQGISTARDISTDNTTTVVTVDGLIECVHNVAAQYRPKSKWVMSDALVKQVKKLKDGDGQYLWQPGLTMSEPDRLLGYPIVVSNYAPSTFTTGRYVAVFGDFSYYWVARELAFEIEILRELFAATNQVGVVCRTEIDAAPVYELAFSRLKLA